MYSARGNVPLNHKIGGLDEVDYTELTPLPRRGCDYIQYMLLSR